MPGNVMRKAVFELCEGFTYSRDPRVRACVRVADWLVDATNH